MGSSLPRFGNYQAAIFSFDTPAVSANDRFHPHPLLPRLGSEETSGITPSAWSGSAGKRIFDLACVLCTLPLAMPIFLLVALAVRLTSPGPALFRQERVGRNGRTFTILKFRTMPVWAEGAGQPPLTTANNQRFTPIGPFLRRWKLDELPQLIHILRGEMSLVGPRPKLPCLEVSCLEMPYLDGAHLACRPGLTGFATMVFAREETALASLPHADVLAYYQGVIKPFKHRLDAAYMARAGFLSDLRIVLKCLFRAWGDVALSELPPQDGLEGSELSAPAWIEAQAGDLHRTPALAPQPAFAAPGS
jgi:lipopolysaccharide/colanic/teichoic acid biosynthesis glycosyltransferase